MPKLTVHGPFNSCATRFAINPDKSRFPKKENGFYYEKWTLIQVCFKLKVCTYNVGTSIPIWLHSSLEGPYTPGTFNPACRIRTVI